MAPYHPEQSILLTNKHTSCKRLPALLEKFLTFENIDMKKEDGSWNELQQLNGSTDYQQLVAASCVMILQAFAHVEYSSALYSAPPHVVAATHR